jgi:hypothetical protein
MRRFLFAIPLGLIAMLLLATPALAGVSWCRADPMISLNGKVSNTWVSTPKEKFLERATGPTEVVYTIPAGVEHELIVTDNGFGYGYDVRFIESASMHVNADGSIPVHVAVYVPSSTKMPVRVEWEPVDGSGVIATVTNTSNKWISFTTVMP